jgi:hypothetical protein
MPDTPETPRYRRPAGLGTHGRRFWKSVTEAFRLRPDELVLLESACRTLDIEHDLRAAMVGEPLMVEGSRGQLREHPLLSEARAQRSQLRSLLAALKLPDSDAGAVNQQRAAAQSRWSATHGARSSR